MHSNGKIGFQGTSALIICTPTNHSVLSSEKTYLEKVQFIQRKKKGSSAPQQHSMDKCIWWWWWKQRLCAKDILSGHEEALVKAALSNSSYLKGISCEKVCFLLAHTPHGNSSFSRLSINTYLSSLGHSTESQASLLSELFPLCHIDISNSDSTHSVFTYPSPVSIF